jgi:hypothetical protein
MPVQLRDLIASATAALPKSRPSGDFKAFLSEILNEYLEAVQRLDTHDPEAIDVLNNIHLVRAAVGQLPAAVEAAYEGKPDESVSLVAGVLESYRAQLERLSSIAMDRSALGSLYRMRLGNAAARYGVGDLFHIPFDKRYQITNRRYSFPGLPCLYLGHSLYVCWEELGRPDLNAVAISRLELRDTQTVKILDLSYRPKDVDGFDAAIPARRRIDVATIWPLLAACSVRVEPFDANFRAEYIVPQAVLRWLVKGGDFDGLRYFSTHVLDEVSNRVAVNFVFPARSSSVAGHCSVLASKFAVSDPINWQLASMLPMGKYARDRNAEMAFGGTRDDPGAYGQTRFWEMEARLQSYPCKAVP